MLIMYIKREGAREGERKRERERAHVQERSACVRAHAQVLIMSSFQCSVGSRFFAVGVVNIIAHNLPQ